MTTLAGGLSPVFILEEPQDGKEWSMKSSFFEARDYQERAYNKFMSNMPCDYVASIQFLFPRNVSFVVEKFTSYLTHFTQGKRFCTLVTNDGRRITMSDEKHLLKKYAEDIGKARRGLVNKMGDGIACHDNPYLTVQ